MKNFIVAANGIPALLSQLHRLTMEVCTQLEGYVSVHSDHHLHAAKDSSHKLFRLSSFVDNKRLKPFCKEFDRCCALLTLPAVNIDVGAKLLIKAGLLLEASLSQANKGVQAQYLSVDAFELLRAYRNGTPSLLEKVKALRMKGSSRQFYLCLHFSVEKILNRMRHDAEKTRAVEASAQTTIALHCFERFTNFPLDNSWKNKNTILKLVFIEVASAHAGRGVKECEPGKPVLGLEALNYGLACHSVLLLMQERLSLLLDLCEKMDAHTLAEIEQKVTEMILLTQLVSLNKNTRALHGILESARKHIRKLQCWPRHLHDNTELLLLFLLQTLRILVSMINPGAFQVLSNVSASSLAQRCEYSWQKIYQQYQISSQLKAQFVHSLQEEFRKEISLIEREFDKYLGSVKKQNDMLPIESEVFWALNRVRAAAFCVGDFALYECACWVLRLYSLAVERRVMLRSDFVALLPKLLGMALARDGSEKQSLYKQFKHALLQEELIARQCLCATKYASSERLAEFLSRNIRELIIYPEKLYESPSAVRGLVAENRRCLLELNMLSIGARNLHVDRVADLSEALEQTHSALCALPDLEHVELPALLGPAHQLLRESLNRAAARQHVEDNRGVVAELYLFLEKSLPMVAPKWRRRGLRQRSKQLVNHLDSNLATVEALMRTHTLALLASKHPLLARLLVEQRSLLQQLQEELDEAQRVRFVRVRARLQRFVARQANDAGKLVRLQICNESLQFRRATIASLMVPLQQLLRIVIEQGIEGEAIRRLRIKPKVGVISMQVRQQNKGIRVDLSDDGQEIPAQQIQAVERSLQAIGGALTHDYLPLQGNRLKLVLAG